MPIHLEQCIETIYERYSVVLLQQKKNFGNRVLSFSSD